MRRTALVCCVALVLAACGRSYNREMAYSLRGAPAVMADMAAPAAGIVAPANSNALFSQQHDLTLTMPHAGKERLQQACTRDIRMKHRRCAALCTLHVPSPTPLSKTKELKVLVSP